MKIGDKANHDAFLELLPWFVNDSLDEQERDRVNSHLAGCELCRNERDQLQRLQDLVTSEEFDPPDYRFSFQKLMTRIDAAENKRDETRSMDMKWPAFATAATLVIGVFIVSVLQSPATDTPRSDDPFRTLTMGDAPIGIAHRVELTFQLPIKHVARRAALIETNSYIVSGPDEKGRYIIEVSVPEDLTDAEFVHYLQQIDGVEHAVYVQTTTNQPR